MASDEFVSMKTTTENWPRHRSAVTSLSYKRIQCRPCSLDSHWRRIVRSEVRENDSIRFSRCPFNLLSPQVRRRSRSARSDGRQRSTEAEDEATFANDQRELSRENAKSPPDQSTVIGLDIAISSAFTQPYALSITVTTHAEHHW